MDDHRKKAYRCLLYYAIVLTQRQFESDDQLLAKHDEHYIELVGSINSWLHSVALSNYLDDWDNFDEASFWQQYQPLEQEFPAVFQVFKVTFDKQLKSK